jgi:hypothetical protein
MFLQPLSSEVAAERIAQFKAQFPRAAAASNGRAERAVQISTTVSMIETTQDPHIYLVRSESNPAGRYTVDSQAKTCTCPDAGKHAATGVVCKHRLAVAYLTGFGQAQPAQQTTPEALNVLENKRFVLMEQFGSLTHQIMYWPAQHRTPENKARVIELWHALTDVQDLIDALQPAPIAIAAEVTK